MKNLEGEQTNLSEIEKTKKIYREDLKGSIVLTIVGGYLVGSRLLNNDNPLTTSLTDIQTYAQVVLRDIIPFSSLGIGLCGTFRSCAGLIRVNAVLQILRRDQMTKNTQSNINDHEKVQ